MFSVILNPSNFFFSSFGNATLKENYIDDCLNLVDSEFNFLDFHYMNIALQDNLVSFKFNTSLCTADNITSIFTRDWFKRARNAWSNCVDEFSIANFVQSLKCNCIHDFSTRDPDQVSIVEICHQQACSCEGNAYFIFLLSPAYSPHILSSRQLVSLVLSIYIITHCVCACRDACIGSVFRCSSYPRESSSCRCSNNVLLYIHCLGPSYLLVV